jgi:hypothetical protein
MNIFVLDKDPYRAAEMLCDKHVVKMCLETAQILSTINDGPYKPTHMKHPCTLWAGEFMGNYRWLVAHGKGIAMEYEHRYGKRHKSEEIIYALDWPLKLLPEGHSDFALAMPDQYKTKDAVESYRNYYMSKKDFCNWTNREIPEWFLEKLDVSCA